MKRFVRRFIVSKALAGSGRGWSAVAVVLVGLRVVRRALGREERVILRQELPAGSTWLISNLGPRGPKGR